MKSLVAGVAGFAAGVMILVVCLQRESLAQTISFISPDGQYEAMLVQTGPRTKHYEVKDTKEHKTLLTTNAEYTASNDVKAGVFSPDSTRFAAAYHYGRDDQHPNGYTWIGIWDIKRRELLRSIEKPNWILVDKSIFEEIR